MTGDTRVALWSAPALTAGAGVLALGTLGVLGLLSAWVSPDTPSYLAADGLGDRRLPVYGWLLRLLPNGGMTMPLLQWAAFLAASCTLVASIARSGASWAAALAVGLALTWSNLVLLWGNALLPEILGHAALLVALAATLDLAGHGSRRIGISAASIGVTLAWALRPSLLPFVVLLPLLPLLLRPRRRAIAAWLAAACIAPVLLLSAVRLARHNDFNVVSFGGFQMAGMAALILTPAVATRLPPSDAALARTIIQRRTELEAAGTAIAIPANSAGQRAFVSAAVFYFDILARTHDAVLYGVVAQLQQPGEDWPAFNRRMQRLAIATLKAAPASYAAWVLGATARLVGHAIVLNPSFLLASTAWLLLAFRTPCRKTGGDLRLLLVLVTVYTLGTGMLAVLVTFPASRYIDDAAMLLAALPFYGALRRLGSVTTPPGAAGS